MNPRSLHPMGTAIPFERAAMVRRLAGEEFDVLVIGGGVTGCGVALDAATRGLRTALVERDDFASGTSSKSSKLVHGGLRYLQQGDVRLVYEALRERQRLLRNAPHLVTVLPFLIPILTKDGPVSKKVAKALRTAMWMYDLTGGVRIGKRHQRLDADATFEHCPTLPPDRVALRVRLLRRQHRRRPPHADDRPHRRRARRRGREPLHGGRPAPSAPTGPGTSPGRASTPATATFDVRARVVVSATGVWADEVRALDEGTHPDSIRPAKGVHVTIPWELVRNDIAVIISVPGDKRSLFLVPWGARADGTFEHCYIGTTDTDYDGDLDDPQTNDDDLDYVLGPSTAALTTTITRDDVTGVWAGSAAARQGRRVGSHGRSVAPPPGQRVAGRRDHGHRRQAHDLPRDGRGHRRRRDGWLGRKGRCRTRRLRLAGARSCRRPRRARRRRPRCWARRWSPGSPTGAPRPCTPCATRWRPRLIDVLTRRTRAHLHDRAATLAAAPDVAALLAGELGWDATETAAQVDAYRVLCAAEIAAAQPTRSTPRARGDTVTTPTPPIELTGTASHLGEPAPLPDGFLATLAGACEVDHRHRHRSPSPAATGGRSRCTGRSPARCRRGPPSSPDRTTPAQVAAVLAACNDAHVPVTPAAGRSGVCGAAVPVFGGVVLDLTALDRLGAVDAVSGVVEVGAGMFGPDLERALNTHHGLTSVTSRRASTSPRSAAGSRAVAPASTRRATARSRTWSSGWRWCSPTDGRAHRRRSGRRGRARPQPAVHRVGGHARGDHAGLAARPPGRRRAAPCRVPVR